MKRLAALFILGVLVGCSGNTPEGERPPIDHNMVPNQDLESSVSSDSQQSSESDLQGLIPLIPIPADYRAVLLFEYNMDADNEDEQLIIVQPIPDEDSPLPYLELWIADYRSNRNEYLLAYKAKLKAQIPNSVSLVAKDITGSLYNEVLITGFSEENHQTLDVFYSPNRITDFQPILNISILGSIEILYHSNGPGNSNDQGANRSEIKINTIEQEEAREGESAALLETTWVLNQNTHQFYRESQVRSALDDVQREELQRLMQADQETFMNHLAGFWYRTGGDQGNELIQVFIDPRESRLIFHRPGEIELYDMSYIHKGIYSKIYISSINSHIRNTKRNVSITLEELDQVFMIIEDNNDTSAVQSFWTGRYVRMEEEILQSLVASRSSSVLVDPKILRGKYRNSEGEELHFDTPPLLSYFDGQRETQGSYALLELDGETILEINYFNRRGIKTEQLFYRIILRQEDNENFRIRSLILTPGRMSVQGFQANGERNISFEQIEALNS